MKERARNLSAEERRAATVRTVVELAAERNPAEITTGAIAERMGVSQGALFRHFPTKDAVLEATMVWVSERLMARLDAAAAKAESPVAALEAMFMTHIDFVCGHPGVPRMLLGSLQRSGDTLAKRTVQTLIAQYEQRLRRLMETGKARGELDVALNVDAAAILFIGTIQGLVVQSLLATETARIRRDAPAVFAIYRRGIEVRSVEGRRTETLPVEGPAAQTRPAVARPAKARSAVTRLTKAQPAAARSTGDQS